ncbi:MAG: DNA cytosine methyltransferase [Gemmatimonadaceae bacterium]|nr:DNA cytosine methyltransferase [Gemmatimonadaceae bacterium]MCW5827101.1 DNA cytosine methyltransferase [Gemmatimonadaceae bacterium]
MPRVLDLFAGCGGLSYGLELAGFEVVAGNDIAASAAETHRLNHPRSRFFLGSITEPALREEIIAYARAQNVDVVVGGPPCQAYSVAGKRDVDDERGHLFEDYVAVVDALRPKFFVMENVKGLLSMKHDRTDLSASDQATLDRIKVLEKEQIRLRKLRKQHKNTDRIPFTAADAEHLQQVNAEYAQLQRMAAKLRESVPERIVSRLERLGYRVEYRVLNAADYGVPQRRERVIFVGTRLDVPIVFPEPTHREPSSATSLFDAALLPWVTTQDAIGDLEDAPENVEWSHEFTRHKPDFVERLAQTPVGGSVYEGFSDAWYRQPPDEPSRTVKENHGGVFVHYRHPRVLTPRELARLQSFPDSFRFAGPKSKVLVQIGNAVPPLLGRAIGTAIQAMLATATAPAKRKRSA